MDGYTVPEELDYSQLADELQLEEGVDFYGHLAALGGLLLCLVTVLGSIAAGWALLWHAALHKIGMFREMMGLKKPKDPEVKRQAELDIQRIKKQLSRSSPATSLSSGEPMPSTHSSTGHSTGDSSKPWKGD